jgi:HD superfamily phosphodiesterase
VIAAKEAYELMIEGGLQEDADQYYKENQALIDLEYQYKGYEKMIRQYNQSINQLTKEDKELYKDDIDKLYDERTQIMRDFNKEYGEAMFKNRKNPLKSILNMK